MEYVHYYSLVLHTQIIRSPECLTNCTFNQCYAFYN